MPNPAPPSEEQSVLEYTLTVHDRVSWQLWHLERSGGLKKVRRTNWWRQLGVLMLLFPLPISAIVPHNLPGTVVVFAVAAFVALIFAVATAILPDRTYEDVARRLTRRARRSSPVDGPIGLWLDDAGLTVRTRVGTQHRAWQALRGVAETPLHVFVLIGESTAIIVPRRADPGRVMRIAERITERLHEPAPQPAKAAPDPVAASPTVPDPPPTVTPSGPPTDWAAPLDFGGRRLPMLTFQVTLADVVAATLDHPAALTRYRKALEHDNRTRLWLLLANSFPVILLINLFALRLGWVRSLVLAAVFVGIGALGRVGWTANIMKKHLPAQVEKQARHQLASRGEIRRLWADAAGITVADAVTSWQAGWDGVQLAESNHHIVVYAPTGTLAIPKRLGQPVAIFLRYAHGKARWC